MNDLEIGCIVVPSWDKNHKYKVLELLNFCGECNVRIIRVDKPNIFENKIFTCTSCLQKSNDQIVMYEQLKLF